MEGKIHLFGHFLTFQVIASNKGEARVILFYRLLEQLASVGNRSIYVIFSLRSLTYLQSFIMVNNN